MKNNRTFLEKLLDGAEVEWKPLIKVASLTRGRVISKEYLANNLGDYPVYSSQTVNNGEIGKINSFDFDGEFVSWTTDGANAGTVFYRSGKFSITNVCGLIKIQNNLELNYKFLFYWLSIEAKNHVYSGMGNPKLMSHQMEKILIPIPPLSVQTEIVKILDALTALTSELTSELILRQKQYEYYREKLLSEEELGKVGFEWKTIDEISKKISSGGTPTTSNNGYYDNGTIPWLRTQEVDFKEIWDTNIKITEDALNNSSAKWIPANCVIVAMYGATVGKTAINKIPLTTNQACANIEINDKLACYRYIFHYLTSKYEYIKSLGSGSQTNINAQIIKKLKVPVPPIEEQHRIVSILDKFETLTNSITEGLPLAIEQSQKRYEYYRELLLNFS
ncbi:TPA: restriction endonuclease subunit S [Haemophilus influenzae]|uniref:restriction endonuclease subunit S n=1 Tax=Haemophilus influenzae TaxID=727 RepID=UPI000D017E90|nr:restriction endonuclease subunit S [Haemophilus influenzae]MCK8984279.1 restriction endonuclease subunit S [Haemophilus influenzae]PRL88582.1 putative type-1 restriction enzyme specificity protein [Haemophilus influenzae]